MPFFFRMMNATKQLYALFQQYGEISTDTRKKLEDTIFFALSGEHFNGNRFAGQALEKGASAVVVDDPSVVVEGDVRYFLVENVLKALQELARYHRRHFACPVIGITGTNGKTTTKEAVKRVLSSEKQVVATEGNLNNHIGVPLTLLRLNATTDFAVVEMGANHPGEIEFLCHIAEPTHGLITNVGKAHLEGFGSLEGVIKTKKELYNYLAQKGGVAFVNADDTRLMEFSAGLLRVTYGAAEADFRGRLLENTNHLSLVWYDQEQQYTLRTQLYGSYNFYNLLAGIAVGRYFGVGPDHIRRALESWQPDNNRSQQLATPSNQVILDAYNANPESMKMAITDFAQHQFEHPMLILGDMFELGEEAVKEHQAVVELIQKHAFQSVILVGETFALFKDHPNLTVFKNTNEAIAFLKRHPVRHRHILVKGSRGMKLEQLVPYL